MTEPTNREILQSIEKISLLQQSNHAANEAKNAEFHAHLKMVADKLREEMREGYPGGDPVGHRRAHESIIEANRARADMYRQLKSNLLIGGVKGILLFIGAAVLYYLGEVILKGRAP